MRYFIPIIPTWCVKLLGMESFSREVTDYFTKSVENIVKYREENSIRRGDFLDLLIDMKNRTDNDKLKDAQENQELAEFIAQVGEKSKKSNNVGW